MEQNTAMQTHAQQLTGVFPGKKNADPKAPWLLKAGAIVAPILAFAAEYWVSMVLAAMGSKVHSIIIARMSGTLIALVGFPLLIVLLFQIGKRFRNPYSRWSIFLYVSLFLLLSKIFKLFKIISIGLG